MSAAELRLHTLRSTDRATLRVAAEMLERSAEWFRRNFPLSPTLGPFSDEQYRRIGDDLRQLAARELGRAVLDAVDDTNGAYLRAVMRRAALLTAELEALEALVVEDAEVASARGDWGDGPPPLHMDDSDRYDDSGADR